MAIDPIKIREQAYQSKRQSIEEDRADDLDRIQKRYKKEIDTVKDTRQNDIKDVYSKEAEEISDTQRRSKERINKVNAGVTEALRRHQEETSQLTTEAQKRLQFQTNELAKHSKEIEAQRDMYSTRGEAVMKNLMETQNKNYQAEKAELQKSEENLYQRHNDKVRDLTSNQAETLSKMREDNRMSVQNERADISKQERTLKDDRDRVKQVYAGAIESERRKGQDQIEELRSGLEIARNKVEGEHDDSLVNLARNNRSRVQQEMLRGQREVNRTQDFYNDQIREKKGSGDKEIYTAQEQKEKMLGHVKNEQDTEMHLATQAFLNQKHNFENSTTKVVSDYDKNLKETREKYSQDFQLQTNAMKDKFGKTFNNENQKYLAEIKAQDARGQKQLNDVKIAGAVKSAEYSKVARDPFYRLRQFDADFRDEGRELTLKIRVPEEEQDRIRVTGKQGQLSLSGSRRFEDKMTTEEGRQVSTNSFQSYSEVIPMNGTPDIARMSRTYQNGVLHVRIPKV